MHGDVSPEQSDGTAEAALTAGLLLGLELNGGSGIPYAATTAVPAS